jgi:hypothetical protein
MSWMSTVFVCFPLPWSCSLPTISLVLVGHLNVISQNYHVNVISNRALLVTSSIMHHIIIILSCKINSIWLMISLCRCSSSRGMLF